MYESSSLKKKGQLQISQDIDEMVKFQHKMHISNVVTSNIFIPFSVRM